MNKLFIVFCIFLLSCQQKEIPAECNRAIGKLFFSDTEIEVGTINLNKTYQTTLLVYNPMGQNVQFRVLKEHPEIEVTRTQNGERVSAEETFTLARRSLDSLHIRFCGQDTSLYGAYYNGIHFEVDGKTLVTGILVDATIIDDFEGATIGISPQISVDKDTLTLYFKQDSIPSEVTASVAIANEGNSNLIIRKIETTCDCVSPTLDKHIIAPQEKVELNLQINPLFSIGSVIQKVRLVSNDPSSPLTEIIIRNIVEP